MFKGDILITGASSGIGKACVLYLSQKNYHVVAGVLNEVEAERLREEIEPEKVRIIIMDVADENSIQEAYHEIQKEIPHGLDGIINNAGIVVAGPAELIPLSEYNRQFKVNFFGTIRISQLFLPLLRRKKGRIVNFSSVLGRVCLPAHAAYCASKFAIEAFTDILRMELKSQGIEVVLIEPGSVRSNIWNVALASEEKIFHDSPMAKRKYYKYLNEATKRTLNSFFSRSIDPVNVAQIVFKALTVPRPKTRYMVGWDVKLLNLLRLVPDRLRDRIMYKIMGLSPNSKRIESTPLEDIKFSG